MDFPLVVPDGVTPIDAFRAWAYGAAMAPGVLFPVSFVDATTSPWEGAERDWVISSCRADEVEAGTHRSPQMDCTCGFHAVKELETLRQMFGYWPGSFLGRVQLAGTIIEHELGYRAERARIVELIPWRGHEERVSVLALLLGLPMGDPVLPLPVPPPVPPGPGDDPSSPQRPVNSWVRTPLADCRSSVRLPFAA